MKKNMGTADRIIRLVIAVTITSLYYYGALSGTLGIVLIILSAVFLITGFAGFCPLYVPFGCSTCSRPLK